jgi:hypothetical protein
MSTIRIAELLKSVQKLNVIFIQLADVSRTHHEITGCYQLDTRLQVLEN